MPKKPKLGHQVKTFRLDRQMTQKQAADFFNVSRSTILRLERGEDCGDLVAAKVARLIQQGQAV
jgi:DNA-binding XRE family transcriptional regulator